MSTCSKRSLTRRMLSATKANRGLSKMASCTPAMKRKRRSLQTSPISRRKFKVQNQFLIPTSAEVIEQLVHHQEQTVIGELLVERRHHLLEGALIIGDLASVGEGKADTQCVQVLRQFGDENVAQRHRRGANLSADYLK